MCIASPAEGAAGVPGDARIRCKKKKENVFIARLTPYLTQQSAPFQRPSRAQASPTVNQEAVPILKENVVVPLGSMMDPEHFRLNFIIGGLLSVVNGCRGRLLEIGEVGARSDTFNFYPIKRQILGFRMITFFHATEIFLLFPFPTTVNAGKLEFLYAPNVKSISIWKAK